MNRSLLAVSFLGSLFASCLSYTSSYQLGADSQVLATRESASGGRETYRLEVRSDATLRVIRDGEQERPQLGLALAEVDKQQAERRGVKPYSGLLVKSVQPGSGAREAGVLAGDVVLALDGHPTVYLEQATTFEAGLRADQRVAARVLRGQDEMDLTIEAKALRERVSTEQEVALEVPVVPHPPYCGITMRGIPAVWCERMFGQPRQAIVVTAVEVGSPAWLAGMRPGDVIDTVDGAPVPDVHELARRIEQSGQSEQAMEFGVHRGTGPSHVGVAKLGNYSEESRIQIPLLFSSRDGTYEDRWSVGWGLLLYNRNRYVANAATREAQTTNVFGALLGLVRVATSPDRTDVRLLWFIHIRG